MVIQQSRSPFIGKRKKQKLTTGKKREREDGLGSPRGGSKDSEMLKHPVEKVCVFCEKGLKPKSESLFLGTESSLFHEFGEN